jgi:hypothetical protein
MKLLVTLETNPYIGSTHQSNNYELNSLFSLQLACESSVEHALKNSPYQLSNVELNQLDLVILSLSS